MGTIENTYPDLPERLSGLEELSSNLWWSWHPGARMLFKMLDRQVWKESRHNPVKVLKELPRKDFESAAADKDYLRHYDIVLSRFRNELNEKRCLLIDDINNEDINKIAYFSAEYGLHHSLPFYAGGLGFLAGDFVKECSDLRVPLIAVGFMYPDGYLKQQIREDGWQENIKQILDRDTASIFRVLDENENQLIVKVPLIEPPIHVAVWKIAVGRGSLYLMDTDIEINDPWNRKISARLYTGDI